MSSNNSSKLLLLVFLAFCFPLFGSWLSPTELSFSHKGAIHLSYPPEALRSSGGTIVERIDATSHNFHISRGNKFADKKQEFFFAFNPLDCFLTGKNGEQMRFLLYNSANISNPLLPLGEASEINILRGYLSKGEIIQDASYFIGLPEGQWLPEGIYSGSFDIQLYSGLFEMRPQFVRSQRIHVFATVPSILEVTLTDCMNGAMTGKSAAIHFDQLETGIATEFWMEVFTNRDLQLMVESHNQGKLTSKKESIEYTLSIDGKEVGLKGKGNTVQRYPMNTSDMGLQIWFEVVIGDVSEKMEGRYSDTLVITLRSVG